MCIKSRYIFLFNYSRESLIASRANKHLEKKKLIGGRQRAELKSGRNSQEWRRDSTVSEAHKPPIKYNMLRVNLIIMTTVGNFFPTLINLRDYALIKNAALNNFAELFPGDAKY